MDLKWLALPAAIFLVVFPLQAIIAALLVASLFVIAGSYTLWMMTHLTDSARLHSLDRTVHYTLIGALAAGMIAAALWPIATAIAVFALAVVASAAWVVLDYSMRHGRPAPSPSAPSADPTDEPEFWAEALLAPTPEPEPPEPVPSDPTPRVRPLASRRPAPRSRRLGPPSPRTRATRVRSRARA